MKLTIITGPHKSGKSALGKLIHETEGEGSYLRDLDSKDLFLPALIYGGTHHAKSMVIVFPNISAQMLDFAINYRSVTQVQVIICNIHSKSDRSSANNTEGSSSPPCEGPH